MSGIGRKGWVCAALAVAVFATGAYADDLLVVDLSVPDQITVTATAGLSAITTSGSDGVGVYFENFYSGAGSSNLLTNTTLVFGDLVSAGTTTNNNPRLFRGGSGADLGLNIWNWTNDASSTFTTGSVAFTGSATWDLPAAIYAEMVAGATSGDLYFPADSNDDIATGGLSPLGTWTVVPEPGTLSLLAVCLGLGLRRSRH